MSAEERVRRAEPPAPAPFTNYRLVGTVLRGVTAQQVVSASPYRGSSHDE